MTDGIINIDFKSVGLIKIKNSIKKGIKAKIQHYIVYQTRNKSMFLFKSV